MNARAHLAEGESVIRTNDAIRDDSELAARRGGLAIVVIVGVVVVAQRAGRRVGDGLEERVTRPQGAHDLGGPFVAGGGESIRHSLDRDGKDGSRRRGENILHVELLHDNFARIRGIDRRSLCAHAHCH